MGEHAWRALLAGSPYAAILALGLGGVLVVGANLSNAIPSASRPFGWPGPASFEAGVATMRPELILATTLPALLLGLASLGRLEPRRDRLDAFAAVAAADALLLAAGTTLAAAIGGWAASTHKPDAFWGFVVAHLLLALSFHAIGALARVLARRHALPAALGAWVLFVAVMEDWVQWKVMREAGYHEIMAGNFPGWFYAAQAASPVSVYRGILILWDKGFRDWTERAALDGAALPGWMTASNFAWLALGLWVLLPLAAAGAVWWWRGRTPEAAPAPAAAVEPAPQPAEE